MATEQSLIDLNSPFNRRSLVAAAVSWPVAGFLMVSGCSPLVHHYLPVLAAPLIQDIYVEAKKLFKGATFSAGEILTKMTPGAGFVNGDGSTIPKLVDKFTSTFITPVSVLRLYRQMYIQLDSRREDGWHLISGGNSNNQFYQIHHYWLSWYVDKDTCHLRINGNSYFGPCKINGCEVHVTRQEFLDVGDKPVTLLKTLEQTSQQTSQHEKHTKPWPGCSVPNSVNGTGPECIFGDGKK